MPSETGKVPNKHTIAMGELIRKAREEAGLSQEELAREIYRKRLAVSEMENGKVEINAWVLPYLSTTLKKPIAYFFPSIDKNEPEEGDLTDLEKELIINFREVWYEELQRVGIELIKSLGTFDPYKHIVSSMNEFEDRLRFRKDYLEKFGMKKKKSNKSS